VTERKKTGVALWATVALVVVLVGYPLSFGPACWLSARGAIPEMVIKYAYWPLLCQRVHLPNSIGAAIGWYGSVGVPRGGAVVFIIDDLEGDTISATFVGADP
jgi:hypothetical protein